MKFLAMLLPMFLSSCISATASVENVCTSQDLSFPGAPPVVSDIVGEQTSSVQFSNDVSGTLEKISSFATVSVSNANIETQSNIDLSFIHHVLITIHPANDAKNELVLSDAAFSGKRVAISADEEKLLEMLKGGPVTLSITGTGKIPVESTETNVKFCLNVSARAQKTISEIGK